MQSPPKKSGSELPPLTARHWLALAGALAVFAVLAVLTLVPRGADLDYASLANGPEDDRVHALAKIAAPEFARNDILVLGNSAAREALWSDQALSSALTSSRGRSAAVANLTTGGQKLIEALYLLHTVQITPRQSVVLFIAPAEFLGNPSRFREMMMGTMFHHPRPFATTYAEQIPFLREWSEPGAHIAVELSLVRNQIYRNTHKRLKNWVRRNIYGDALTQAYNFADQKAGDINVQQDQVEWKRQVLDKHFANDFAVGVTVLEAIIAHVRQRQARLVLLESPMLHRGAEYAGESWWVLYQSAIERITAEHGVIYADLNQSADLRDEDYVDARHVTRSGRDKWSAAFVEWIAPVSQGAHP